MSDGAILDLVTRGRKDAYFIGSTGGSRSYFGADYERRGPSAREIRIVYPETGARFGHWVDIELPRTGDVLMSADVRIQMPTWLPPAIAAKNRLKGVDVTIESQVWPGNNLHYGWTNGIANYLIKRWALYADSVQLVHGWGGFNSWFPDMETTHAAAPILHATTGTHNGSDRNIQWNATPPELVFRVPLVGCQGDGDAGLPLCALQGQRLYLRFWLASAAELVESGLFDTVEDASTNRFLPRYERCPAPWGGRAGVLTEAGATTTEFRTLQFYELGQPYLYGRFAILHLDDEGRRALQAKSQDIVFRQQRREDFTIEHKDWNPAARFKKQLEIHGFFQALFLQIIGDARLAQNKYRDITPPDGSDWVMNLSLNVNGVERIDFWPPKKFQELANNTQFRRDIEAELYSMVFGVNPDMFPAGTCNLTRTHKVLLAMQLEDVPLDPVSDTNQAEATILGLSWNVFHVEGGVGRLLFAG